MSDFIDELMAGRGLVERQITVMGKTGTVHFKRLTSGQREQLLQGQKVSARNGEKAVVELDLGLNHRTRQLLVQFSVCRADGAAVFADIKAVQAADAGLIEALYEHAEAVNSDEDLGKD